MKSYLKNPKGQILVEGGLVVVAIVLAVVGVLTLIHMFFSPAAKPYQNAVKQVDISIGNTVYATTLDEAVKVYTGGAIVAGDYIFNCGPYGTGNRATFTFNSLRLDKFPKTCPTDLPGVVEQLRQMLEDARKAVANDKELLPHNSSVWESMVKELERWIIYLGG